ncbi:flagellar basal body-associated FliL family protein [Planktotalea arctica]|uniref:flagellar basal body-associated FliL family protein n=1 Tax=Planktotalea arctica TaxID=1481893 RepID=UPI00321B4976
MVDEDEPKKKSGILKILIFVFAGVAVLGVGLGAGYLLFGAQPNSPEQLAAELIERNNPAPAQGEEPSEDGEEKAVNEKVSKESTKDEVFQTLYFEIPGTLTTNLKNSRRFLQVGIGISTQYDDQILRNVEAHLPAVKAAILATLSDYGEEDVVGREARKTLADDLKAAINEEMMRLEGFGGVEGVHLTSYVMQ